MHAVLDGYASEAAVARGRARARGRDERRPRRDERPRLPDRARDALRLGDATARRRGGGADDLPRRHVRDASSTAETLLVDIGGGSTELLVGGPGGVSFSRSLQAGCVRLTERFLTSDPPAAAEVEAAAAHVRGLLPALEVECAIGVAGTITTVAAIDLGLEEYDPQRIHGHRISTAAAERVLAELSALPLPSVSA